jgi:putative ABC transport system permease protein
MRFSDGIFIAFHALATNKVRSALVMLGMIIGVSAVIVLLSLGRGVQAMITDQITSLGTNLLFIRAGTQNAGGVRTTGGSATLTYEDAQAIGDRVADIGGVTVLAFGSVQLIALGQNISAPVLGTTPAYLDLRNTQVNQGNFFSEQELTLGTPVVVIGDRVAQTLFGASDAVGQQIRIATGRTNVSFRVVGVMAPKGGTGATNEDDQVFIPVTTFVRRLNDQRTTQGDLRVDEVDVQLLNKDDTAAVTEDISILLRERHGVIEDDFTIFSQQQILQTLNTALGGFTILLGSIAGISLIVGGIGIMNIMLVSVTERTREIGIRKAVGAKRQDILMQFLVEAVVVSGLGGALGVLIGVGLSSLANGIPLGGDQTLQTVVGLDSIIVAFAVSAGIGIFFGLYPAVRASRLTPVEALRYE